MDSTYIPSNEAADNPNSPASDASAMNNNTALYENKLNQRKILQMVLAREVMTAQLKRLRRPALIGAHRDPSIESADVDTLVQRRKLLHVMNQRDKELKKLKAEQAKLEAEQAKLEAEQAKLEAEQAKLEAKETTIEPPSAIQPGPAAGASDHNSADKVYTTRKLITEELLSTETCYVGFLHLALKFQKTLSSHPLVKPEDIQAIFSNLREIYYHNSRFLENLTRRLEYWEPSQMLGDVVLESLDTLQCYTTYVANYNNAIEVLERLKTNPKIAAVVKEMEQDPVCKGLNLPAFLIMPIQRIPRYALLLMELIKNTEESHRDYKYLLEALDKTKALATTLNEARRMAEQQAKEAKETTEAAGQPAWKSPRRSRAGTMRFIRAKSHKALLIVASSIPIGPQEEVDLP